MARSLEPHPSEPAGRPDFDSWVAARAPALTRFAYVLTGDPARCDDAVQHALASAYPRWQRLAGGDGLESELRAAVVRHHLRRRRYGGRGRAHTAAPAGDPPDDAAANRGGDQSDEQSASDPWLPVPEAAGDLRRESSLVWLRMAGLPPGPRAALVLRCYEGLGVAETAAETGGRRRRVADDLEHALDQTAPGPVVTRRARLAEVGEALQEYAERAPQPYAPAERAVARAHRQRRRRITTGGTVAAALVLPTVWALVGGSPAPRPPVPRSQNATVDVSGWRWESWGGIQVRVPGEWGHGDLTQWCTTRGTDGPAVDRPEYVSTNALCSLSDNGRPTYTSGLLLRRAEDSPRLSRADVAPNATSRMSSVGGVMLTLVDIDPAVGSAVMASAQVIGRRDFNGCAPHHAPDHAPDRAADRAGSTGTPRDARGAVTRIGSVDAVSVCRYGLPGWDRPTLISSRRLTGSRAGYVLHALQSAPAGPPSDAGPRCHRPTAEFAVLELWRHGRRGSVVVRYDGCRGHGVDDGHVSRRLTARVLEPILVPPWSGDLTRDVRRAAAGPQR